MLNTYTLTSGGLLAPRLMPRLGAKPLIVAGILPAIGALGLSVLVAVYGTASRNAASHPTPGLAPAAQAQQVLTHGIATAFGFAAILGTCSLLVIVTLIRTVKPASDRTPARQEQEQAIPS